MTTCNFFYKGTMYGPLRNNNMQNKKYLLIVSLGLVEVLAHINLSA